MSANMSCRLVLCACILAAAGGAMAQSLYDPAAFSAIAADRRNFKVGDLITVLVVENSTATSTANTDTSRDGDLGVRVNTISQSRVFGLGTQTAHGGGGHTVRSGKLLAQVTLTVTSVDASGNLSLVGEQLMTINDEEQRISVAGVARSQDIGEGNTVSSSRLANAKIAYLGDGVLAEKQKPGWWQRLLAAFGL